MAVSKKVLGLVKESIDYGINKGLPEFMLFIVYARARKTPQNGWAIIGATSKKEAKDIARNDGWLSSARIGLVHTFEEYCHEMKITDPDEEYNRLKRLNKLPQKVRDWYELEWGI